MEFLSLLRNVFSHCQEERLFNSFVSGTILLIVRTDGSSFLIENYISTCEIMQARACLKAKGTYVGVMKHYFLIFQRIDYCCGGNKGS